MRVVYINLDIQTERRDFVEAQVRRFLPRDWPCERYSAVSKATINPADYASKLPAGAIGLLLSHRDAVRRSLDHDDHLLLLEDDVLLGPSTHAALELALSQAHPDAWDLLFTDACIPLPAQMIDFLRLRKTHQGKLMNFDLRKIVFAGSTSIVINRKCKEKYLALLTDDVLFTLPIDLLIRKFVLEGRLNARLAFPFITSLSKFAESSQIQAEGSEMENLLWNTFRQLVWIDRDLASVDASLAKIPPRFIQEDARRLGLILAGFLSFRKAE